MHLPSTRRREASSGLTFVVLPNPCWLLSRELLYTALTRQQRSASSSCIKAMYVSYVEYAREKPLRNRAEG